MREEELWSKKSVTSDPPLPELPFDELSPSVLPLKLNHRALAAQLVREGLAPPLDVLSPQWLGDEQRASRLCERVTRPSAPLPPPSVSQPSPRLPSRPSSLPPRTGYFEVSEPPEDAPEDLPEDVLGGPWYGEGLQRPSYLSEASIKTTRPAPQSPPEPLEPEEEPLEPEEEPLELEEEPLEPEEEPLELEEEPLEPEEEPLEQTWLSPQLLARALDSLPAQEVLAERYKSSMPPLTSQLIQALMPYSEPMQALQADNLELFEPLEPLEPLEVEEPPLELEREARWEEDADTLPPLAVVMKREPLEHVNVRPREPVDRFHADLPLEGLLALRRGATPPPLSLRFKRQGGLQRALDTHAHSPLEHLNLKRSVALVARAGGEG